MSRDAKPETWRDVPDWPGYQVSTKGHVRKVRLLAGKNLMLRHKGRQITTTAGALFAKAFGKAALIDGTKVVRYKPGQFWKLTRDFFANTATFAEYVGHVIDYERDTFNLLTQDTTAFRRNLWKTLWTYRQEGLIDRVARSTYRLTDKGQRK